MIYDKTIQGLTVTLRSVEESDAEATLAMRMNPAINQYLNKVEGSVEKQRDFIRKQRANEGDYLFIAETLEGEPIGMRGITDYDAVNRTCETGRLIGLGNAAQNIEIALLGYDFAFDVLGVETIYMTVVENNASILRGQKRYGAEEVSREFSEQFGCDIITSKLEHDRYRERLPHLMKLVRRFSER